MRLIETQLRTGGGAGNQEFQPGQGNKVGGRRMGSGRYVEGEFKAV